MRVDLEGLIRRYRKSGLLVDTNLLLVFIIGSYRQDLVEQFKRTIQYKKEDYELLAQTISRFAKIITTPNILTEVNSLSNQLTQSHKEAYYPVFTEQIRSMLEIYVPSIELSSDPEFSDLGLADVSILQAARAGYLVLTDDARLFVRLNVRRIDVINFSNLRSD